MNLGKLISDRIRETGMTKAEFGRRINTSRQNVNSLLQKDSMDTSVLSKISFALDYDFFGHIDRPATAKKEVTGDSTKAYLLLEVPPDQIEYIKHIFG